jgi:hypothetical protein
LLWTETHDIGKQFETDTAAAFCESHLERVEVEGLIEAVTSGELLVGVEATLD